MNNGKQQNPHPHSEQHALVPVETSPNAAALVPSTIDGAYQLARWLGNANLLPPALKGREADIFTMILAGMELGLPPMSALRGMYIVNGKPALEAKTKAAICLQRGAALYITRVEYTSEATTWETLRKGSAEPVKSRYTRKEAKEAGLLDKDGPWRNYAQRMISHRALGWLCDDVYPDIVLGVATAEDFDDEQMSFKPIAVVGPGVEVGSKPAAAPVIQTTTTPKAEATTPAESVPDSRQLTEDEIVDLIKAMDACKTVPQLRELAANRIAGVPEGPIRDRLAKAYENAKEFIVEVERTERSGQ